MKQKRKYKKKASYSKYSNANDRGNKDVDIEKIID